MCVAVPPPSVPSFLIFDPNASPAPVIVWCRPNAVPTAMLQELATAIGTNMNSLQLAAFANALKPFICPC